MSYMACTQAQVSNIEIIGSEFSLGLDRIPLKSTTTTLRVSGPHTERAADGAARIRNRMLGPSGINPAPIPSRPDIGPIYGL